MGAACAKTENPEALMIGPCPINYKDNDFGFASSGRVHVMHNICL